jgi:hypothetical protein
LAPPLSKSHRLPTTNATPNAIARSWNGGIDLRVTVKVANVAHIKTARQPTSVALRLTAAFLASSLAASR